MMKKEMYNKHTSQLHTQTYNYDYQTEHSVMTDFVLHTLKKNL